MNLLEKAIKENEITIINRITWHKEERGEKVIECVVMKKQILAPYKIDDKPKDCSEIPVEKNLN